MITIFSKKCAYFILFYISFHLFFEGNYLISTIYLYPTYVLLVAQLKEKSQAPSLGKGMDVNFIWYLLVLTPLCQEKEEELGIFFGAPSSLHALPPLRFGDHHLSTSQKQQLPNSCLCFSFVPFGRDYNLFSKNHFSPSPPAPTQI